MGKPSISQDALIGQVVGGRYEIVRLIGKGGMGAIYEVRNTRLGRSFALKTLTGEAAEDAEVIQRFRREADVLANIKHPNILEAIDWEELPDGSPCMVLELLRGEDLAVRVERGPLDWPELARIADQVLAALSVAHGAGIVHRDLKPSNVFLANDDSGDEKVKLLDFGVSKIRDSKSLVTTDARLLGTPSYMAPEQAEGRADSVGTATDVWAMGTIVYEMATGVLAFDGPSLPAVLYKVCHAECPPLASKRSDAPPELVALLGEVMVRDVDARISDATVLRVRLREALRKLPGVVYADHVPALRAQSSPSASGPLTPGGRRKRWTGATNETVATPPSGVRAIGHAETVASVSTLAPSPSMIGRRRLAPLAIALGVIAAAAIAATIVLATRDKSDPPPAQPVVHAPAPAPAPVPAAAPVPDPVPAAAPVPDPVPVTVPVPPPPPAAKTHADRPKRVEPKPIETRTPPSPAVEPPKPAEPPKKKTCAKDDMACIYGGGD